MKQAIFLLKKSSSLIYETTRSFKHCFPKQLNEFWLSAYKSYSVIIAKAIKIIVPFASSLLCEYGFSALAEIKSKKRASLLELTTKCGCAWQRRNLFSILFVPKNRHTHRIRIRFFKTTLFLSVP